MNALVNSTFSLKFWELKSTHELYSLTWRQFALRLVFNLKPDDGAIRYQHMNTDNLPKTIKDTQEWGQMLQTATSTCVLPDTQPDEWGHSSQAGALDFQEEPWPEVTLAVQLPKVRSRLGNDWREKENVGGRDSGPCGVRLARPLHLSTLLSLPVTPLNRWRVHFLLAHS